MNRKKRAVVNIICSLLLEIVTIGSGLIVPRLIIEAYGSGTNGLVNSITSFIGYIALLQSGIGAVIRSALYRPLAKHDHEAVCIIATTTERFFRKIAYVSIAYIIALAFLFPTVITKEYDFAFTFILVIIIGVSTAAQYFFGITSQKILEADQSSFIYSVIQIATVVLNTVFSVILIKSGCSIQQVKAVASIFFVARPLIIGAYTKRKYNLTNKYGINNELIAQRWDGLAQGLAYFLHSKTDVFVLTVLSSLENVSIYSVYALVTTGLTSIVNSIDKAIKAVLGNIFANDDIDEIRGCFDSYLNMTHFITTVLFATASVSVFKFVELYTKGVTDAEYIQPLFAIIIISAESLYCYRLPYNAIINVAGKFKETKRDAMIEAVINIVLSCILVPFFGLVGVAIGTWVAMIFRTVSFIIFLHTDVLMLDYKNQLKRYLTTFLSYIVCVAIGIQININVPDYLVWLIYTVAVMIVTGALTLMVNLVMMKKETLSAVKFLFKSKRNNT